jgi:flagellar motor switch protein FliG
MADAIAQSNATPGPDLEDPVIRSAILLTTLGQDAAVQVFKELDPRQAEQIATAMLNLKRVDQDAVMLVMGHFVTDLERMSPFPFGSEDFVMGALVNAFGEEKAQAMTGRLSAEEATPGMERLSWMEPKVIAELIQHEHTQVIAVVLSHLDTERAGQVANLLPDRTRNEALLRVATLDSIQPEAMRWLDGAFERLLDRAKTVKASTVGGVKIAANIVNFLDSAKGDGVISLMRESDPELAEKVRDETFSWNDFFNLDDRAIQMVVKDVPRDDLLLAMKGTTENQRVKIFRNMSSRAAESLKEDLDASTPAKLSDVEGKRKSVVSVARKLAESGEISLGKGGADEQMV